MNIESLDSKVSDNIEYETERIFEEIGIKLKNHPIKPLPVELSLNDYLKSNKEEIKSSENSKFTIGIDFGGNSYVLTGYDNQIKPPVPKVIEDVYSQKKTQYSTLE